jgi:hypothetical protein
LRYNRLPNFIGGCNKEFRFLHACIKDIIKKKISCRKCTWTVCEDSSKAHPEHVRSSSSPSFELWKDISEVEEHVFPNRISKKPVAMEANLLLHLDIYWAVSILEYCGEANCGGL